MGTQSLQENMSTAGIPSMWHLREETLTPVSPQLLGWSLTQRTSSYRTHRTSSVNVCDVDAKQMCFLLSSQIW